MAKWDEAARTIQRKDKYELNSLPGSYIIRKKFNIETQEQMLALSTGIQMEYDESGNPKEITKVKEGEYRKLHESVIKGGLLEFHYQEEIVDIDDPEFLNTLMKYPEVEQEIFSAISEFNRPLAQENSSRSETVLNGLSTEKSSGLETPSLTEENHTES